MSATSPWLALSVDWMDSDMFDEATHGERLAWVCLLCHAKSQGRGGRVRLRKNAFAHTYRLSARSVDGMLLRAQKCAAVKLDGEFVTLSNWGTYQGKASSAKARDSSRFPETQETCLTKDHSHITHHTSHPPPPKGGVDGPDEPEGKPGRFVKPTVSEVAAYVWDNSFNVDPQQFVDYYESVGWMVGKGKRMKDWKASVRGWHSRNKPKDPASRIMTKEDAKNWTPE